VTGFGQVEDINIITVTGRSLTPDIIGEMDIGTRFAADIDGRKADGINNNRAVNVGRLVVQQTIKSVNGLLSTDHLFPPDSPSNENLKHKTIRCLGQSKSRSNI